MALPLVVGPADSSSAAGCAHGERLEGVGFVCPLPNGLFEVFSPEGESQGTTHGPDRRESHAVDHEDAPVAASQGATFECVDGAPGTYYTRLFYARAIDDADGYQAQLPIIRREVAEANALVDAAAVAMGDRLSLRILCEGGVPFVEHVVLPTPRAGADFSTIVRDLKALGFTDPRQKHWVFYDDDTACACLGVGHFYLDESPGVDNLNNGAPDAEPMFAVAFGAVEASAMLHELAHTLGAVQDGAPNSTHAGHCYDGRDTMCYNDGGPRGNLYTTTACATTVFDCGQNTYCNAYPTDGSWLATHWQACSRLSRYLSYPPNVAPIIAELTCGPAPSYPDEEVTCTFHAQDASPRVAYDVSWGDGASVRVPATGGLPPAQTVTVRHSYAAQGNGVFRVIATDVGYPPLTSAPAELAYEVLAPEPAPVLSPVACTEPAREGIALECTLSATAPHDVFYTLDWDDGSPAVRIPASGSVPPGEPYAATHTYPRGGEYTLRASVFADGRPPRSATAQRTLMVEDINEAPRMSSLSCPIPRPRPGQSVSCSARADDDSAGVAYTIDWGDGTVERVPAAGTAPPGVAQTSFHTYAADGNYTVRATATDDGIPSATSGALTFVFRVAADQEGPSMVIEEPTGGVYSGCARLRTAAGPPIFFQRGCVQVTASDPAGVTRVEVLRGTTVLARSDEPPYRMEFPVPAIEPSAQFKVRAWDAKGNARLIGFTAHAFGGTG